ncbi:MAG: hypothetical protein AAGC68_09690, partial [Verrucomicrobiota bacterium]
KRPKSAMLLAAGAMYEPGFFTNGVTQDGYQISSRKRGDGWYQIFVEKPGAFRSRNKDEFVIIPTIWGNETRDEIPSSSAFIIDSDTLEVDVYTKDIQDEGDDDGFFSDCAFFVSIYDTKVNAQPDARIGHKSLPQTQAGNDRYNQSGAGQQVRTRLKKSGRGRFYFSIENDGNVSDQYSLRQTGPKKQFRTKYFLAGAGRANVTALVRSGAIIPTALRTESAQSFEAQVKPKRGKSTRKGRFGILSQSALDGTSVDSVRALLVAPRK